MAIKPITPSTLDATTMGKCWLHSATAAVQPAKTSAHNNKEPSCPPQTAEIL